MSAIKKALSREFQESLKDIVPPYGEGDASHKIKEFLKNVSLEGVIIKKFFDIGI